MSYRLPRGLAEIKRNPEPVSRFCANYWPWLAVIDGKTTYCLTRDCARDVVARYRNERARLLRAGERSQARAEFHN